jgi:hypothetical protein
MSLSKAKGGVSPSPSPSASPPAAAVWLAGLLAVWELELEEVLLLLEAGAVGWVMLDDEPEGGGEVLVVVVVAAALARLLLLLVPRMMMPSRMAWAVA